MQFEVEQKFRVENIEDVRDHAETLGAAFAPPMTQIDQYFAHPARDYSETDEALRIRRVADQNVVTYKGPKLDATTKTRRELELPIEAGDEGAERFGQLLLALGFTPVAEVSKRRHSARLKWRDKSIEIALDDVGSLGWFVELEVLADETELDTARAAIASLAIKLGLTDNERAGYMELLFQAKGSAPPR